MTDAVATATRPAETRPQARKRRRWPWVIGILGLLLIIGIVLFQWDWLIPLVDKQASAALGRTVTISHLHVRLGRVPHIVADDVVIGNPADWPGEGQFATADHLVLDVDAMAYIKGRQLILRTIQLDHPVVDAQQNADGTANWTFGSNASSGGSNSSSGPGVQIGDLVINDGQAHVRSAKLAADFQITAATKEGGDGGKGQIVAAAKGTYAKQPITANLVGGALLSLRDASEPYPIDLKLANGPTTVALNGTVQDPLHFAGAAVKLAFAGPDMSLLLPLTGIAIPKTPPYRVTGNLDFADGVVKFQNFAGRVGSSDLEGSIDVDTKPARKVLTANLHSKLVDLKDLGGFIGAEPGDADKGTKRPVASNGRVLPTDPISVPRLNVADVHLKYTAGRIEGRRQPLDNMRADLDIVNGNVHLHPISFGIGRGTISGDIELVERAKQALAAKATIDFKQVDVDKLLTAAGVGQGAGAISGRAVIDGYGSSIAQMLGDGNGELKLYMGAGGNLSALLVDLSGLEFGNALLSALGLPQRAAIQCLVTDFVLKGGEATSRLTMLDTDEARVGITGDVNLRDEALNLTLRTEAKHFSIGSLPAPINIRGSLGAPSIRPDIAAVGVRAGAAVGLGILNPLAALLPTIQLGTGEDNACASLTHAAQTPPRVPSAAPARPVRRRR